MLSSMIVTSWNWSWGVICNDVTESENVIESVVDDVTIWNWSWSAICLDVTESENVIESVVDDVTIWNWSWSAICLDVTESESVIENVLVLLACLACCLAASVSPGGALGSSPRKIGKMHKNG